MPCPLVDLFKSIPGIQQIVAYGTTPPPFDVHIPLLSLPHIFGTALETVPAEVPYLAGFRGQESELIQNSKFKIQNLPTPHSPLPTPLKIGIVWSGNPENPYNRTRACPLEMLLSLGDLRNVHLYSLQKEVQPEDLERLRSHPNVKDLRENLTGFVETASLIEQLDLIISVDTAVTHLAGALGKPVWLLLPFAPDWRWMLEREDSPWYPTMRLFRQASYADWVGVIERVREALLEETGGHYPSTITHQPLPLTHLKPQISPSQLLEEVIQYYQNGNLAEAERICRSILQQEPNHVETLNILG